MTDVANNPQVMEELLDRALAGVKHSFGRAVDEVVVNLGAEDLLAACRRAKGEPALDFDYLRCMSAVDYDDRFELVYHLCSVSLGHRAVFKVAVPKSEARAPQVSSVISVWKGADWHEREIRDMFGIGFRGHPHLVPLLMDNGLEDVHPLLRSRPLVPRREIRGN